MRNTTPKSVTVTPTPPPAPRSATPRILLAEDSAADAYLVLAAFKEHGLDAPLEVATDGEQVLRILSRPRGPDDASLDLIILDLNLPRYDGIEILRQLRATEGLAGVPVIVLTSSDSPQDRFAATQLGVARYLRKPTDLKQFLNLGAVFRDVLGLAEADSEGTEGIPE